MYMRKIFRPIAPCQGCLEKEIINMFSLLKMIYDEPKVARSIKPLCPQIIIIVRR